MEGQMADGAPPSRVSSLLLQFGAYSRYYHKEIEDTTKGNGRFRRAGETTDIHARDLRT